ncbi:MAG: SHOCT domain-containing protein [Chloroflexi bacterium]|nr:SHOCT domain-containing protein [Chloroflexota bacterium]
MHDGGWYPFGGGWLIGLLVFGAFVVLMAWGIAWILRHDSPRYGAPPPPPSAVYPPARTDTALQILRERFARGEISEAEYVTASRVLGAPEPPKPGTGQPPGPPAS